LQANKEWRLDRTYMTTNTKLNFFEAYHIYSIRWSIEVLFKEAKSLLGLGKSHARDFASQIASISITVLQYNILGTVKRFKSYETHMYFIHKHVMNIIFTYVGSIRPLK
jgi:hypothetical protein